MVLSDGLDALSVESVAESGETWNAVTDSLPDGDCRYVVYDLEMTKRLDFNDMQTTNRKYAFMSWIPTRNGFGRSSIE